MSAKQTSIEPLAAAHGSASFDGVHREADIDTRRESRRRAVRDADEIASLM